ncbi:alpha/beta hydrolase [Mycobacterium sp. 050128]|uniref:alpha/beta fold hydrolase n=1 Tax=Mycobacterium sp. 050128 TaxID=3096112 RepID=UPI002ED9E6C2
MTTALEEWRNGGETVVMTLRGTPRRVFVRRVGQGAPLILLHGFPASSFEWSAIEPELARHHEVISFDFLGYGASDKPLGHRYSVFEQADLAQAVIAAYAASAPTVVAYDYGAIVATELLARREEGGADIKRCILLNAGLFADRYRPRIAQRASLIPVVGALLARVFTESMFVRTWGEVFSPEHPLDRELAVLHYHAFRENDPGRDIQRKLLRYIPERAANKVRFEGALTRTAVALSFLWGMRDPVSGAAIAEELHNRMPAADLIEYDDAGHCPHIEIPERIAADILARSTE